MSKGEFGEDKTIDKKKLMLKVSFILYYTFISYTFFLSLSIECKLRKIESNEIQLNDSTIFLKVKGPGNITIISPFFETLPNEIYINGIRQNEVINFYYLNESENNIILKWKYELNSTNQMFQGCSNITEIDFSGFSTSNIKNMGKMFYQCSSLKSIELSNFDTSNVETMELMFSSCSSLTSLNLSSFNIEKVRTIRYMFSNCKSLISLDLSNFNLKNADIYGRIVIDISSTVPKLNPSNNAPTKENENFFTYQIFYGCSSLSYLILSNLDTSKDLNIE